MADRNIAPFGFFAFGCGVLSGGAFSQPANAVLLRGPVAEGGCCPEWLKRLLPAAGTPAKLRCRSRAAASPAATAGSIAESKIKHNSAEAVVEVMENIEDISSA